MRQPCTCDKCQGKITQLELDFSEEELELEPGISNITPPPDLTRLRDGRVVVDTETRIRMLMKLIKLDRYW